MSKQRSAVPARNRYRNLDSLHIQRERANKRERERTKALNSAYSKLRQKIPSLPSDKTSKIHTLRVTVEYIHFLRELASPSGGIDFAEYAVHDPDRRINLPATFNSWRTGLSQRWKAATATAITTQLNKSAGSSKSNSTADSSFPLGYGAEFSGSPSVSHFPIQPADSSGASTSANIEKSFYVQNIAADSIQWIPTQPFGYSAISEIIGDAICGLPTTSIA